MANRAGSGLRPVLAVKRWLWRSLELDLLVGRATLGGDGLVLVSGLLTAMLAVAQARLLPGRDPVAVTAVQFLGAALGALAYTVAPMA
jgi:hypothetical protein